MQALILEASFRASGGFRWLSGSDLRNLLINNNKSSNISPKNSLEWSFQRQNGPYNDSGSLSITPEEDSFIVR